MTDKAITATVSILIAISGVAIIAVLVSRGAQTGNVFGAFGKAISQALCTALSPITGTKCSSLTEQVTSTITF